jgi:aryl-alcohol dehydrogenase-like predicted oxidoreductase
MDVMGESQASSLMDRSASPGTGLRSKIFLATKFGFTKEGKIRGDAAFVKSEIASSLEKLQTDSVDLCYVHRTDPTVPIEITMSTLKEHVE